jgi:hypothetical protein
MSQDPQEQPYDYLPNPKTNPPPTLPPIRTRRSPRALRAGGTEDPRRAGAEVRAGSKKLKLSAEGPPVAHRDRRAFAPPCRAERCRDGIWRSLKERPDQLVTILDLIRDLDFPARDMYRAAKALVHRGLIERSDVTWSELGTDGIEKTHPLIAVRFVPEWGAAGSRKW